MTWKEQNLQKQCVAWFRAQYPQYAMLMTHPINEGGRNTARVGGIHKGEGTVAGVPDLLLFIPMHYELPGHPGIYQCRYHCLGIEMKTQKGRQSQEQKDFKRVFEAAGNKYVIVRSLEEFMKVINNYIAQVEVDRKKMIAEETAAIIREREEKEREHFYKVIGKKDPSKTT